MAQFPATTGANGVWGMMAIRNALMGSNWPSSYLTIIQTFTATQSWTPPTGVTSVDYLIVGGGGGGGKESGGGGGAGGFRLGTNLTVSSSTTYTINVGAAGSAGSPGVAGGSG